MATTANAVAVATTPPTATTPTTNTATTPDDKSSRQFPKAGTRALLIEKVKYILHVESLIQMLSEKTWIFLSNNIMQISINSVISLV